jgi:SAM-dependent methyltransferase
MRSVWGTVRPVYINTRELAGELAFERRYGLRTSERAIAQTLALPSARLMRPTGWWVLRRILPADEVGFDDVFLDIGSGSGRVVFLAARYPFRRVIGVERDARLVEMAESNVAGNRERLGCAEIEFVNADAAAFEVPDDVTVAFMYNPFQGETFRTVISAIIDSYDRSPRRLRFIYSNPVEHDHLIGTGRFREIRRLRGWRPGGEWSRSNSVRLYEAC